MIKYIKGAGQGASTWTWDATTTNWYSTGTAADIRFLTTSYSENNSVFGIWTEQPPNVMWQEIDFNDAPEVGVVILNGGNNISLTESVTTTVQATATVTDKDGFSDLKIVSGKLYYSGVGSGCTANDNTCYSDSACATSSCSGNNCIATCEYEVWFHATPTDGGSDSSFWGALISATDREEADSTATTSEELSTLRALDLSTSTIAYGSLDPGEDSSTLNQTSTVSNTGNEAIDIYLYGTDMENGTLGGTWYDSNWLYRKKITIDNTKVDDDLTDFPVLVSVTDSSFSSDVQYDSDDILFTQSDGATKLNHEIEKYTSSTGELAAWVQSDLASTTDTDIYMYYGYAAASNQENATSVWDSNYIAVWHMDGADDTTVYDSTGVYDSTAHVADSISGQIGDARDFDNSNSEYVSFGDMAQPCDGSLDVGVIEYWISQNATRSAHMTKYDTHADPDELTYLTRVYEDGDIQSRIWDGDDNANRWGYITTNPQVTMDGTTWTHVAIVYEFASELMTIYANGSSVAVTKEVDVGTGPTVWKDNPEDDRIGVLEPGTGVLDYYDFSIDEIRYSRATRSAEWISASYNNQSAPSTFMNWGSKESQSIIPVGHQEWATGTSVSYDSGTDLTKATSTAVELDLSKPTSHPSTSTDDIHWGVAIPSPFPSGTYTGTTTFESKAD
jgi:hypothetical protein